MKKFFDVQSSALEPKLVRVAIVTVCLLWAFMELMRGALIWAMLFGAAGAYLFHQFFVVWNPDKPEDKDE